MYKDDATGSFYAVENGALIQYPMNLDDTPDTKTDIVVDWDFVATELPIIVGDREVDLYTHLRCIEDLIIKEGMAK